MVYAMIPWWWSILLAALGISGLYLAGSNRWQGWVIGVAVQVLWIVYAITTGQYGFIASAIAYAAVNARNWRRWFRQQTEKQPAA